ncbi:MAG TPA: hypothetical protein DD433_03605 [Ruminococcaceae bacterium]|jgi:hypothetical protein|nr:hypothetical protein [Oscillospiraceae bacterium]
MAMKKKAPIRQTAENFPAVSSGSAGKNTRAASPGRNRKYPRKNRDWNIPADRARVNPFRRASRKKWTVMKNERATLKICKITFHDRPKRMACPLPGKAEGRAAESSPDFQRARKRAEIHKISSTDGAAAFFAFITDPPLPSVFKTLL